MQGEANRCVNRLRVEVLPAKNANALLEEMHKRREEEKTVWKCERNWLQEEVLEEKNALASLQEIRKKWEEDNAVWQRAVWKRKRGGGSGSEILPGSPDIPRCCWGGGCSVGRCELSSRMLTYADVC